MCLQSIVNSGTPELLVEYSILWQHLQMSDKVRKIIRILAFNDDFRRNDFFVFPTKNRKSVPYTVAGSGNLRL